MQRTPLFPALLFFVTVLFHTTHAEASTHQFQAASAKHIKTRTRLFDYLSSLFSSSDIATLQNEVKRLKKERRLLRKQLAKLLEEQQDSACARKQLIVTLSVFLEHLRCTIGSYDDYIEALAHKVQAMVN